jgi:hypothetical protein
LALRVVGASARSRNVTAFTADERAKNCQTTEFESRQKWDA